MVLTPTTGTSKRMSCLRLADFHDDEPLAAGNARGALDGFVGSFHGFDGHAGAIANHHRLSQVEAGDLPRDLPSVGDVGSFARHRGRAASKRLRRASSGPRNFVESTSSMPSSSQHPRHGADQRIGIFRRQRKQQLRQPPVRPDGAENLVVLHLPGHHGVLHTLLMQQFDAAAQLAQADPVQPLARRARARATLLREWRSPPFRCRGCARLPAQEKENRRFRR